MLRAKYSPMYHWILVYRPIPDLLWSIKIAKISTVCQRRTLLSRWVQWSLMRNIRCLQEDLICRMKTIRTECCADSGQQSTSPSTIAARTGFLGWLARKSTPREKVDVITTLFSRLFVKYLRVDNLPHYDNNGDIVHWFSKSMLNS